MQSRDQTATKAKTQHTHTNITWPRIERNNAGWKMDVIGRTELSLDSGLALLMVINDTDMSIPRAVICLSPYLTPSRYSTDSEYAEIRQFNARIWWETGGREGARTS